MKTTHQYRVEDFMLKAGQEVPEFHTKLTPEVRHLRAKLILEECLETIKGLGIKVMAKDHDMLEIEFERLDFYVEETYDPIEVVDGCCDIKVVTTGTLSAMGLPDEDFQQIVDEWNRRKFGPGSYKRADGKYMKPPGFKGPNEDIAILLKELGPSPIWPD